MLPSPCRTTFGLFSLTFVLGVSGQCVATGDQGGQTQGTQPIAITPETPAISWDVARQDRRITALAQDKRGHIFVASEESGVWMCGTSLHSDKGWRRFTSQHSNIADDNIYALTIDQQDRVWAGTAGHGVSVYNGSGWKNYNSLKAPIGERIFAIAVNPLDGDVWLASNVGLTRYSVSKDTWTTRYAAPHLPFNHIEAMAFTAQGNIVIGTQTDGVLLADAKNQYSKWRLVSVADADANWPQVGWTQSNQPPDKGLPSNMVNDVLVARDGTIYVATTGGLAWSRDKGATWSFWHGADYGNKLRGRWKAVVPAVFLPAPTPILSEDNVSCLAQDKAGMLWIGHWRKGYEVFDPKTQKFIFSGAPGDKSDDPNSNDAGGYVKCILPLNGQAPLIGHYGQGLTVAPRNFTQAIANTTPKTPLSSTRTSTRNAADLVTTTVTTYSTNDAVDVPFPTPMQVPTLNELNALLKQLGAVPVAEKSETSPVVALDDDWSTRGDWLGRYGRYWANCCAMISPDDYIWGAGAQRIRYHSRLGLNADKDDALRYWVHWLQTDNPNSLEIPPVYMHSRVMAGYSSWKDNRRQSEIDDHGEAYPYEKDGPHLCVSLAVPAGNWTLSLYDWNKDGDGGDNRFRDYRVSIRSHNPFKPLDDIEDFASQPELASARIRDFRRGVWKRFFVRGPQELTIEVNKNYGFNTILAGAMLDELKETTAPYFRSVDDDRVLNAKLAQSASQRIAETPAVYAKGFAPATTANEAATRLLDNLDALRATNPMWFAQSSRRWYLPLMLYWMQAQK